MITLPSILIGSFLISQITLGDNPIDTYTSANAASFRDSLSVRGLSASSINRVFSSVRAVVNLSIQENGLGCSNAFANIYLPKKVTLKEVLNPTK